MSTYEVFLRNAALDTVAEVDDFLDFSFDPQRNDISTWSMTISGASANAAYLHYSSNPNGGVIVKKDGVIVFSGPIASYSESGGTEQGQYDVITVGGTDDTVSVFDRDVFPNPAVLPPDMNVAFYQTASLPAETIMHNLVNLNAGAGVGTINAARQVPHLVQGTNLARGAVQRSPKYRFTNLGQALQELSELSKTITAPATTPDPKTAINFRVIQVGTTLQFQTYTSTTNPALTMFSREDENLAAWEYTVDAPTVTNVVLGAGLTEAEGGIRIARGLFTYEQLDTAFPRRIEDFIDVGVIDPSDADTPLEIDELQQSLDQQAREAFKSGAGQIGATLTPYDTEEQTFGVHYGIGDFITVKLPRITFTECVQAASITLKGGSRPELTISVGSAEGSYKRATPSTYRRIADLKKYMDYLRRNR